MKRSVSVLLLLCFFVVILPSGISAEASEPSKSPYDLGAFQNHEILAVFHDGSTRLFSYESEETFSAGYDALIHDPSVDWIQPNFVYENSSVSDPLFPEQWALYNDGNFALENQENAFPVYQSPFSNPFAPWQWMDPWKIFNHFSEWFGNSQATEETYPASTSGIDIRMLEAWSLYEPRYQTAVAIIDTGIDLSHPELTDAMWINDDEIPGNGKDDDQNGYIDDIHGWNFYDNNNRIFTGATDNHGTHCAGTIAAKTDNSLGISGIAGDGSIRIMSLKALGGTNGEGTTATIIRAIRYAEANGATICNLSLCTPNYDRLFYQVIQNSNMLFVVAAGNGNSSTSGTGYNIDTDRLYPAAFPCSNIIAVANIDPNGFLHKSSCYGASSVDLAAPGTNILSTTADEGYSYMTGTSMAAPMVTGVAAMISSTYPYLSAEEIRSIILNTTTSSDSLKSKVLTGGYLNAEHALTLASEQYAPAYRDIKNHWAEREILIASDWGLINGIGDYRFSPDTEMTRAMAVTVLYRYAGSPSEPLLTAFSDVTPDAWYADAVSWAARYQIALGFPDGTFQPDQPVTKEQMAQLFYRFAFANRPFVRNADLPYRDASSISDWALDGVAWATSIGAFTHCGDSLSPASVATRAEMATLLVYMGESNSEQ